MEYSEEDSELTEEELFEEDLIKTIGRKVIEVDDFNDELGLTKWVNRAAALLANRLTEVMYKPDKISLTINGYAKWDNVSALFNQSCKKRYKTILIRDTLSKIHFLPVVHMDYCIISLDMNLNEETIENLHKITSSVSYEDGVLYASCDFPSAAIAQFAVIKRIDNRKQEIYDAKDTYKTWLKIVHDEWEMIVRGEHIGEALFTSVIERYILN